jgi:hypothetical protein
MISSNKIFHIIEDPDHPGELLLDLGNELCAQLDWQAGDTIEWIDNKDGTWLMTKSASTNTLSNSTQE